MSKDFRLKMKEGQKIGSVNTPAVFINGTGKHTYLWVGNDAPDDKLCFATLSGPKTLEKLAINILKALKSKHHNP